MADFSDLLQAIGESVHHDQQLGDFYTSFGTWRLAATVDFPFQSDVEMFFDLDEKVEMFPPSMRNNVQWIQDHLDEIWNRSASAINGMVESQQIEMSGEFKVDSVCATLPDATIENSNWSFLIELSCAPVSFEIAFRGLTVTGQTCHTT